MSNDMLNHNLTWSTSQTLIIINQTKTKSTSDSLLQNESHQAMPFPYTVSPNESSLSKDVSTQAGVCGLITHNLYGPWNKLVNLRP